LEEYIKKRIKTNDKLKKEYISFFHNTKTNMGFDCALSWEKLVIKHVE